MVTKILASLLAWCCDIHPAVVDPVPPAYITPLRETAPVAGTGDAADDAAIWLNSENPAASRILATEKQYGLRVYDLKGVELQAIAAGRLNNVSLRPLPAGGEFSHVAAASNRSLGSISLFGIQPDGSVLWLQAQEVMTSLDPYGLCMYSHGGQLQVFINDKDGRFQQWAVSADASARLLREFRVHGQPEGCTADDAEGRLFFGIEDEGVYVMSADSDGPAQPTLLAAVDGVNLFSDVEGMSLYAMADGSGYLVVSSQGSNTFAVYNRQPPHALRGLVAIGDNLARGIDGVRDTDGVSVSSAALGEAFPQGLLVVQDGSNSPEDRQNFKLVDWRELALALGLD
ncbi:MAG: phytase [Haliea sp.]|jgi:3-phytase